MFRFNFLILFFSFLNGLTPCSSLAKTNTKGITLSYFSWQEDLSIAQGVSTENSRAQFVGNALGFRYESAPSSNWGYQWEAAVTTGKVTLGENSNQSSYLATSSTYWGANFELSANYRLTPQIIVTGGPLILYRQISKSNNSAGFDLAGGPSVNGGLRMGADLFLSKEWFVQQEIGRLFLSANTYWRFGLGYLF